MAEAREKQPEDTQALKATEDAKKQLIKEATATPVNIQAKADPPLSSYSFQEAAAQVREDAGAAGDSNPATFAYQQAHPEEVAKRQELEQAIYGSTGAAPVTGPSAPTHEEPRVQPPAKNAPSAPKP